MWLPAIMFLNLITKEVLGARPRIVGGIKAENQTDFAYMASLGIPQEVDGVIYHSIFCGGSIIHFEHVLTAAHCCYNDDGSMISPVNTTVAVGQLDLTKIETLVVKQVLLVIPHHLYDGDLLTNDIALLKIVGSFDFTNSKLIRTIPLPTVLPSDGTYCRLSGWGTIDYENASLVQDELRYIDIPIVDLEECRKLMPENTITDRMICAGILGKDPCQGDSGGPMVCNGVVAGIVSYGEGCGDNFGIYTSVVRYKNWIKHTMAAGSSIDPDYDSAAIVSCRYSIFCWMLASLTNIYYSM